MKIGVFAQYINTRNDIRDLITEMNRKGDIILLLNERDKSLADLLGPEIEIRFFNTKKYKYRNYFFEKLFLLFGKLPVSKNNYYITENFKLYNAGLTGFFYYFERGLLSLSKITMKFINYKKYLSFLKTGQGSLLEGIDKFFCITQIYNDAMYAAIQKTGKPVINYVYSWDHACKMKCFLNDKQNTYLTWSEAIRDDVHELQGIEYDNIHVLGATQLIYLSDYLRQQELKHSVKKYIYMVGGTGNGILLKEEVAMMKEIIKTIRKSSGISIKIRPYPFTKAMNVYDQLLSFPDVEIENMQSFEAGKSRLPADYEMKYDTISGAFAFFHFGTTLSLEAAYLNVPVILLDIAHEKNFTQLNGFIHQYQNDKYLNVAGSPNVLCTISELNQLLKRLETPEVFLNYNNALKKVGQVESMDEVIDRLMKEINNAAGCIIN